MNLSNLQHGSCEVFCSKVQTKTRGFFGVPLGTGSEVRANILMYVDPRKFTFSALVREVHWSLKKRFHPVP